MIPVVPGIWNTRLNENKTTQVNITDIIGPTALVSELRLIGGNRAQDLKFSRKANKRKLCFDFQRTAMLECSVVFKTRILNTGESNTSDASRLVYDGTVPNLNMEQYNRVICFLTDFISFYDLPALVNKKPLPAPNPHLCRHLGNKMSSLWEHRLLHVVCNVLTGLFWAWRLEALPLGFLKKRIWASSRHTRGQTTKSSCNPLTYIIT